MVSFMFSVGLSQGVAPLIGYCYGAGQNRRTAEPRALPCSMAAWRAIRRLLPDVGKQLAALFLREQARIEQTAYFLTILCLSAPTLGVINMVTSYFQALGKAAPSLAITVMHNAVLFIPAVILFNSLWGLDGVIAAQPVVEAILTAVCLALYGRELCVGRRRTREPAAA